jgi:hypothetical protein
MVSREVIQRRRKGEEGGFTFSSSPTLEARLPEERGLVWPNLAAADRAVALDVAFLTAAIAIAAGTLAPAPAPVLCSLPSLNFRLSILCDT